MVVANRNFPASERGTLSGLLNHTIEVRILVAGPTNFQKENTMKKAYDHH